MTVENTQNKMPPLQMGTTNEYPFTFAVLLQDPTEEEALEAIKASVLQADGTEIELVYNTDYTVTLNTDRIGGTLTVNDIRTSSDYITIYRQYEQTQEVDYKDFNSAPAETFEQCFDKLTMLSQQQQEEINRSLKLNVSSTIIDPSLPEPIANNTLIWDSVGSSLKNYDIIGENNQFKAEVNAAIAAGQADIQAQFDEFENVINNEIEDVREAAEKINELEQAVDDAQTAANSAEASASDASQAAISATQAAQQTQADIQEIEDKIEEVGGMLSLEIGDIGIALLGIDETKGKRRYLNGQLIIQDQFVEFTKKVKSAISLYPSLACTEEEWQTTATMTVGGQVGKFVVDNDAGTIRLPKIIMPIQGLTDLSKLAEIVEAGLPNITGSAVAILRQQTQGGNPVVSGAFSWADKYEKKATTDSGAGAGFWSESQLKLDASLSNPIYGNSTTVQQEQIQYPYFIQVATGAETEDNIINEIELNNPFSLLDYKYSEYELNNLSWLRSNGQYNSKAIYPAVYDLLLKIYNGTETKAGVSVKLTTETFTDYDFVLNTADETFMLPTKVKLASGKAVVGNGMTLGLMGHVSNVDTFVGLKANQYGQLTTDSNAYGVPQSSDVTTGSSLNGDDSVGVTTDPTKSGIETSNSGLYLYFYVGETVQNANLINAGRIEEKLSDCITRNDCSSYVTETYKNGYSWYRIWSPDSTGYRWCEQGGIYDNGTFAREWHPTITLLKPYKSVNDYIVIGSKSKNDNNLLSGMLTFGNGTNSQFTIQYYGFASGDTARRCDWYACGYIA